MVATNVTARELLFLWREYVLPRWGFLASLTVFTAFVVTTELLELFSARVVIGRVTPQFVDASLLENIALHRVGTWDHAANLAVLDADSSIHADLLLTNNTGLSGGQRARLAVARAAFDRPGVLILDDPSAALDDETANELWQRLRTSSLTVIIASNHPGARAVADQVIVLP